MDRLAELDRPELWITLRSAEDVLVDAKAVDERVRAGEELPLAGLLVAVQDNVDVAGLPTTSGCPAYTYTPEASAVAIGRLTKAGAVVLGKTALEPFATGTSDATAAVAGLGLVDVAIGADPAGAGQVSAAREGVVGLKPTLALVPGTGVVPSVPSFDGVTVFARTVADGQRTLEVLTGTDVWPEDVRLAAGDRPRIAVPAQVGFATVVEDLLAAGAVVESVDLTPFLEAARVFGGSVTAVERYAALGEFAGTADLAPELREKLLAGKEIPAHRFVADRARLDGLRVRAAEVLAGFDAVLLPALPEYTGFLNALDLAAVTVPPGVSVVTRAFDDQVALDLAAFLAGEQIRKPYPATGIDLVVFGAHLRGQPLNRQLTELGARFRGDVLTAERYRMVALADRQPGILSVAEGAPLVGERWTISPAGLGRFLAGLSGPLSLGEIELDDGSTAIGFHCEQQAAAGAVDITEFRDWRAYLRYVTATRPMTG